MEEQRQRARAAQKKEVITVSSITTTQPTEFLGFDEMETKAAVLEIVSLQNRTALILNRSVCYAEMGGQVGDTGTFQVGSQCYSIIDTQKQGELWLHFIKGNETPQPLSEGLLTINSTRRAAIERHHTVTHLLHWALHEIIGAEAIQKGSFVGKDKLTFDFSSAPLTTDQLQAIEALVNKKIVNNHPVLWQEMSYEEVKKHPDIMQFFGDKYGDRVRVVQIGGEVGAFNGFSMELCGGTHVAHTGEIGQFRIISEGAVAAGIRRIEAVAGLVAHEHAVQETTLLRSLATKLRSPIAEVEKKLDAALTKTSSLEKELQLLLQTMAIETASGLLTKSVTLGTTPAIIATLPEANAAKLLAVANALKGRFQGVILLCGTMDHSISLMAVVSADFRKSIPAGKLIQTIAPLIGGKGGGTPESARGGGPNVEDLPTALEKAQELISST